MVGFIRIRRYLLPISHTLSELRDFLRTRARPSLLVCSYQPLNPQLFFLPFFPPGSTSFAEDDRSLLHERIRNKKVGRGRGVWLWSVRIINHTQKKKRIAWQTKTPRRFALERLSIRLQVEPKIIGLLDDVLLLGLSPEGSLLRLGSDERGVVLELLRHLRLVLHRLLQGLQGFLDLVLVPALDLSDEVVELLAGGLRALRDVIGLRETEREREMVE